MIEREKLEIFKEEKSGFRRFLRKKISEISVRLASKDLKFDEKQKLEVELEKVLRILNEITKYD